MCFCKAKQSVMENKVKSTPAPEVGGANIWSFSSISKIKQFIMQNKQKVAQLQKSKVEIFAHLYLFFQSETIYFRN